MGGVVVGEVSAETNCIIPESGPWPPCATGGQTQTASNNSSCVIPTSGPWPPCATGGSSSATQSNSGSDCAIPASGPWPPCATGQPTPTGDCVIPASGPWPSCATGAGNSQANSNQAPRIISFTADTTSCGAGCTEVTLRWPTSGVAYTEIGSRAGGGEFSGFRVIRVAGSSGTLNATHNLSTSEEPRRAYINKTEDYKLTAYGFDNSVVTQRVDVILDCEFEMLLIESDYECAEAAPIETTITTQQFDRGYFVSIDTPKPTTYVLFDDAAYSFIWSVASPTVTYDLGQAIGDAIVSEGHIQTALPSKFGGSGTTVISNVGNEHVLKLEQGGFKQVDSWGFE